MKKIIIGILAIAIAALTAHAGIEFTSVTKAEGGRHADAMGQTIKGTLDGNKAKMEFIKSGNPMTAAGSYMVTEDGETMYLVNPEKKTYSLFDLKAMMGMAGGIMGMMNMQVKDPKTEKLLDESGDKILGYRTTHYKFRTSYTMTMNILGMVHATDTEQEQELWTTESLNDAVKAFRNFQQGMKSGNEDLDKLIAGEMEKAKGFPLKTITTRTTKNGNKSEITRTTMEVTEIKDVRPSASIFKIPEGYKEVSLLRPPEDGAGTNRTRRGTSGTQQADPSDAIKKLLQGFKKPE